MKRRSIWILIGGLALLIVLGVGAAGGAALAFFALRGAPALASALDDKAGAIFEEGPDVTWFGVTQASQDAWDEEGLVITSIDPEGAAAQAGLTRGDIILSLNGDVLDEPLEYYEILRDLEPGDQLEVEYRHGDEERSTSIEVGEQDGRAYLGIFSCGFPFGVAGAVHVFAPDGAHVAEVISGSPAEAAGLQEGDLIIAVDGEEVGPGNSLAEILDDYQPGDEVTLSVEREGEEGLEVQVTLGEDPEEPGEAYLGVRYGAFASRLLEKFENGEFPFERGVPFRGIPFGETFEFRGHELPEGVDSGILIIRVQEDSPADEAGLSKGDVITAIDGEAVDGLDAVKDALAEHAPGDEITLTVIKEGESEPQEVTVTLSEHPQESGEAYLGLTALGFIRVKEGGSGDLFNERREFFFNSPERIRPAEEV